MRCLALFSPSHQRPVVAVVYTPAQSALFTGYPTSCTPCNIDITRLAYPVLLAAVQGRAPPTLTLGLTFTDEFEVATPFEPQFFQSRPIIQGAEAQTRISNF